MPIWLRGRGGLTGWLEGREGREVSITHEVHKYTKMHGVRWSIQCTLPITELSCIKYVCNALYYIWVCIIRMKQHMLSLLHWHLCMNIDCTYGFWWNVGEIQPIMYIYSYLCTYDIYVDIYVPTYLVLDPWIDGGLAASLLLYQSCTLLTAQ